MSVCLSENAVVVIDVEWTENKNRCVLQQYAAVQAPPKLDGVCMYRDRGSELRHETRSHHM